MAPPHPNPPPAEKKELFRHLPRHRGIRAMLLGNFRGVVSDDRFFC